MLWDIIWILSMTSWEVLWSAFGYSLASHLAVSLDTHWKFSLCILTAQSGHSWNEFSFCCPYARNYANIRVKKANSLWQAAEPVFQTPVCRGSICSDQFCSCTTSWLVSCSTALLLISTDRLLLFSFFLSTRSIVSFWQLVLSRKWYQNCVGFCESLPEILQWVD